MPPFYLAKLITLAVYKRLISVALLLSGVPVKTIDSGHARVKVI
jgi:hypothetical protein